MAGRSRFMNLPALLYDCTHKLLSRGIIKWRSVAHIITSILCTVIFHLKWQRFLLGVTWFEFFLERSAISFYPTFSRGLLFVCCKWPHTGVVLARKYWYYAPGCVVFIPRLSTLRVQTRYMDRWWLRLRGITLPGHAAWPRNQMAITIRG